MLLDQPSSDEVEINPHPLRRVLGSGPQALVLFNPKAGSVTEADREKLIDALKAAGIERYALVGAEMMNRRLFKRAKNFDVIIVLGGDGTAKAAAENVPRDAPPLVLLPGGTLNVLPRALYGELAWPEALAAALSRGVVKQLPMGLANGKRFFVAGMFGSLTLLGRVREAVREGHFFKAWARLRHFMKRSFTHSLSARPEHHKRQQAEAIGVLCPSYSGAVEGEDLEWVRLDPERIIDLARVSLRALGETWRDDPTIELARCTRGDIRSHGIIPAVLDGEPATFVSHVRISYDPNGPRVLAVEPELSES